MSDPKMIMDSTDMPVMPIAGSRHGDVNAANEDGVTPVENARRGQPRKLYAPVYFMLIMLIIYFGWRNRGGVYLSPEQGPGYFLGIAGGALMLLLLLYPLRKHIRWMRRLGPVSYWFRAHMIMGVLGPVLILFHCNFQLGSANGNIALFSMLLVSGSGLVGRYLYTRIHYGLYGKKADLAHLGSDTVQAKSRMDMVFAVIPSLQDRLQKLESRAVTHPEGIVTGFICVLVIGFKTRWCWLESAIKLRHAFMGVQQQDLMTSEQRRHYLHKARFYLRAYLGTLRRIAGFSFYERLFSLWHVLHLPLFIMLLISGVVHVYAVHMY